MELENKPLSPAPLLVVLASFDPNGNGLNDYNPEHPEELYDKESPTYGEQWAISSPEECFERFFGDGKSLVGYYKELSLNKFWFYPAPGMPNCGVLPVTVNIPHPAALRNLGDYTNETAAAKAIADIVKKCDDYVDFASFDKDGDGIIQPTELAIVILNAGYDRSSAEADNEFSKVICENGPTPSHRFMVHGTSQPTDVEMRGGVHVVRVSNIGEHRSKRVGLMTIGTPAHELAHNLGAQDMYSRYTGPADAEKRWPTPRRFSLMCSGNHTCDGSMPSYLDPYQRIYFGWAECEISDSDGVYTLYSTLSGKYNILRVNTPDPDEYYLCEIRLKEGFEEMLTGDGAHGGVVVWHIDETINREWFTNAQCVSSNRPNGKRHDLGNAFLPREGLEKISDSENFVRFGPLYADDGKPYSPYFYRSTDPSTSLFDSARYCGAASLSYSLNSFPAGVSKFFSFTLEVLDEPGEEMRVKITRRFNS